jgi:F420H(2)-dependent quinone reductase
VTASSGASKLEKMKHRIVHPLQKYFLNPPIKFLLAIGLVPPGYALLETTVRKTGKPRRTPVGHGRIGNEFWIVAEHGMNASYVRNIAIKIRGAVSFEAQQRWTFLKWAAGLFVNLHPR